MTFLNPAILLGLFAAALPLIIHLFNIRKVKDVEFSSLMFLKEIQKSKIRRVKLKQWLLLLLRTLLIIFLVLAFARPTLETISLGSSSVTKSTVCFIIDNSFSLQLKDEKGTGFNQAKSSIKKIINSLQDNDEISVFTLSGEKAVNISSKKDIFNFLDKQKISVKKPIVSLVFNEVQEIISESKNLIKEIYFVSDFQNNIANELRKVKPASEKIKLFFINTKFDNIDNLSVTNFNLNNKILIKGNEINFSAEIYNSTSKNLSGKVASLIINGERKAQKSFNIDSNESIQLSFDTILDSDGLIEAFIQLEDDTILEDNNRYLSIYVPKELNVLLLTDNLEDSDFINIVLKKQVSLFDIKQTVRSSSQLNSVNLSNFDVVFLIGNKHLSNSPELKSYVSKGGGLIYFPSSTPQLDNINIFLKDYSSLSATDIKITDDVVNYFENIEVEHSLFKDLFSNRKTKFNSPTIKKFIKVTNDPSARKIITLLDKSPVLLEKEIGSGKILIFTISPELSFSNLPIKGIFAPLMNKILLYCGINIKKDNLLLPDGKALIDFNLIVNNQYKVIHPDNSEEYVNLENDFSRQFLEYDRFEINGIYKFYSNNKLIEYFSVNFDPSESELKYINNEEIESLGKQLNPIGFFAQTSINNKIEDLANKARFGTELWQYFLILALIIAFLEMYISRGIKKDFANL